MRQVAEVLTLFDVQQDGTIVIPGELHPDIPVLDGAVEPGVAVPVADREIHIRNTYLALCQLGLASRGEAATTEPAAISRISKEHGPAALLYLTNVGRRTKERLGAARTAVLVSLGGTAMNDDARLIGAWVGFRQSFAGPRNRTARDAFKQNLVDAAERYGYDLPQVS